MCTLLGSLRILSARERESVHKKQNNTYIKSFRCIHLNRCRRRCERSLRNEATEATMIIKSSLIRGTSFHWASSPSCLHSPPWPPSPPSPPLCLFHSLISPPRPILRRRFSSFLAVIFIFFLLSLSSMCTDVK